MVAALVLLLTVCINLVPFGLRREGRWLDGDWLLAWCLRHDLATQRLAVAALYSAIEAGRRPRDLDERWVRLAALQRRDRRCSHEVVGDLLVFSCALDRGLVDEAGRLLARTFAGRRLLPEAACAAVLVESAFFVARHRRRRGLAATLLEAAGPATIPLGKAHRERARAAIHLAAGEWAAAVDACDLALATLDGISDMPAAVLASERDQDSTLRDAALAAASAAAPR